jgi:carbamoyl-phosphate synthase small subunit
MTQPSTHPNSAANAPARLVLEDGATFEGRSFGAHQSVAGEVVFNTGMVGYPESLTDPSYTGEILVLTYPLVGNYGVAASDGWEAGQFESDRPTISALVVSDYSEEHSHWFAGRSLGAWLAEHGVPAITGVDTRTLTRRLRERGTMLGKAQASGEPVALVDPNRENLVARVSPTSPELHGEGAGKRVLLLDCGAKKSIVRRLLSRGFEVLRVPWNHDIAGEEFDGLFLSNGPGDPQRCEEAFPAIRRALEKNKPTFGICLGHQLLALASGAKAIRLKYGHRGQNQPVREVGTNRCLVTSQNHGYAIDLASLPADWRPWFENLNDGTNEGMRHASKPFFSVQFHPEAAPGPADADYLFDEFAALVNGG